MENRILTKEEAGMLDFYRYHPLLPGRDKYQFFCKTCKKWVYLEDELKHKGHEFGKQYRKTTQKKRPF